MLKNEQHSIIGNNFNHQMSQSKSKCWYSNNCLHFLKCVAPLVGWLVCLFFHCVDQMCFGQKFFGQKKWNKILAEYKRSSLYFQNLCNKKEELTRVLVLGKPFQHSLIFVQVLPSRASSWPFLQIFDKSEKVYHGETL